MRFPLLLLLFLALFFSKRLDAQVDSKIKSFYFHWGYNRSAYTKADIHIVGDHENIRIHNARGTDEPSKFKANTYLNPLRFTIPQFDFRIGVELENKWYLSFGWDHLKYVFEPGHYFVSGTINDPEGNDRFNRVYNDSIFINNNFLHLEHTDGLNYIHFSLDKAFVNKTLWKEKVSIELLAELGVGAAAPWTDSQFLGRFYRNPGIRLAGVGVNLGLKPRIYFFQERFFVQSNLRMGYFNMWNIKIHDEVRAKQNFGYAEYAFLIGMKFKIGGKNKALSRS